MKYLKKELKKLLCMVLLLVAIIFPFGLSIVLTLTGFLLLMDHLTVYGRISFYDFFGHEWVGLILMLLGLGISYGSVLAIVGFLVGCDYSWKESENPFEYAIKKVKSVWR